MPNVEDAKTDRKVDHYNCIHNKAIQRGTAAPASIHGAYSYPDITALTQANVSQNPNCTPPIL